MKAKKLKNKIIAAALITAAIFFSLLLAVYIMFGAELKIINSIKKISSDYPVYFMQFKGDYYFEEFLKAGGAASDKEVSSFLSEKISKGFYSVNVENSGAACSVISAKNAKGNHIWGRNFDWSGSVPIIVRCTLENGYSSISVCDFRNINPDTSALPQGTVNSMLAIASLYVPMDGINEAGLCVADLEVNEGGMVTVDTEKPNLTVTTALRLVLNKAATVDEAVALIKQYDIFASGGISHHIALSDANGKSVVLEFINGEIVEVATNFVTNFNMAAGDTGAGGESSKQRYEALSRIYSENNGALDMSVLKHTLMQTAQAGEKQSTQWSVLYDSDSMAVDFYFKGDFTKPYSYTIKE